MVYGICWCPVSKLDELRNIKVADSKTLTAVQRTNLFRNIQKCPWLGYQVDVINADRLSVEMMRRSDARTAPDARELLSDESSQSACASVCSRACVSRHKVSLNVISHDSAIQLIQDVIAHGVNVREVFVDTVGDAGKYQAKLEGIFPGVAITVSKKADSLFPIVSAASIAAKVTRDFHLESWQFSEEAPRPNGRSTPFASLHAHYLRCSRKLGSGYPGDPLTKIWLTNHLDPVFGYPSLVRFSWGTTKKILKNSAVQAEWGDEDEEEDENEVGEDDEEGGKGAQKMDRFFAKGVVSAEEAAARLEKAAAKESAAEAAAALQLKQADPNNKKFSLLHDSVTRKQHALPHTQRAGWFAQHKLDLATTF